MNTTQRTRQLTERMTLDLRFQEARPYLSLFRKLDALPGADSAALMEIPAAAPQADALASDPGSKKRASIFTWGSTLRKSSQLGQGTLVPCLLRADNPVTVSKISAVDLKRFMSDFWAERDADKKWLHQVVPEALGNFVSTFGSTERGAKELSYSVLFALQETMPHSSDATLFYHVMMMDVDESCRFAVTEMRCTMDTLITSVRKDARKFLKEVHKIFPWTVQIQSELTTILDPYLNGPKDLEAKDVLSTKDETSFAEFMVRFFISHRRRLVQRIFHGLTLAAARAWPPEEDLSATDLLHQMVRETFTAIDTQLTPEELQQVAQLAVGSRPLDAKVVEYIKTNRGAAVSTARMEKTSSVANMKSTGGKKKGASSGSKEVWPLSHKLFPVASAADNDEDDLRVMLLMRNLMCIFPEEDSVSLNRVMAKMESSFLTIDQSPATVEGAAAAASHVTGERFTAGSIGVEVLHVDLQNSL